jgi:hypothetical protein
MSCSVIIDLVGVGRWFTALPNSFPLGPFVLPSFENPCIVGNLFTCTPRLKLCLFP